MGTFLEKRRHAETIKILRKKERTVKEVMIQCEEDQKNIALLQESLDKANQKIMLFKRQLQEQVKCDWWQVNCFLRLFVDVDRKECPNNLSPVYVVSKGNSKQPKTVPIPPKAVCHSSVPNTAPLSPPAQFPAAR